MSPLIITNKQTEQPNARQHPFSRQFLVSMQILFSPAMQKLHIIDLPIQHEGLGSEYRVQLGRERERENQTTARSN